MKEKEIETGNQSIRRAAGAAVLASVLLGVMMLSGCKKEESAPVEAQSTAAVSESTAVETGSTAAVSKSVAVEAQSTAVVSESATAEAGEKTVLLDNDIVTLTLNGAAPFSSEQEDDGTTKTAAPEVEISFDVTNKGEEKIILDLRDLKVGETFVKRILLSGDIVAPGDTMTFRYGILPQDPKEGTAEAADPVTWDMAEEQGISGTVRVMNIEGELAQAEFSTAD